MSLYEKDPKLIRHFVLCWALVWSIVPALLHLARGKPNAAAEDVVIALIASAIFLGGYEIWLRWRRRSGTD